MIRNILRTFVAVSTFVCTLNSYAQNPGDTITYLGGKYEILSENLISNPGFADGFTGWTDASSSAGELTTEKFNLVAIGGVDNSRFLMSKTSESATSTGSIGTGWPIEAQKTYYFSYHVKYIDKTLPTGQEEWLKISLTNNKNLTLEPSILLNGATVNGGGEWTPNSVVFTNTNSFLFLMARFRWMENRMGFDEFSLYEVKEIVNTSALEEAIAEAESFYAMGGKGTAALMAAITEARLTLTVGTIEEVKAAVTKLEQHILEYRLLNATPDNPLDFTDHLINPGFDENQSIGWKGAGTVNSNCVEFYEKTFDMHQEITGLPAGKYRLKVQGFERPKNNDAGAAYLAGTEKIAACLYAQSSSFTEKRDTFNSIYQHPYSGAGSQNGYINTMSAAQVVMTGSETNYALLLDQIFMDEGDTLRIGARSAFSQTGYWVLFDNFRLEYCGTLDTTDLKLGLEDQILVANQLLSAKIQKTAADSISEAIQVAEQVLASQPAVYNDLQNASKNLQSTIKIAEASKQAFESLQTAIEKGESKIERFSGARKENLQNAIQQAKLVVDNAVATREEIQTATTNINALILKQIYIPTWMIGDVSNPSNNWSMERSRQSENWIIFWEPGYGADPSVVTDASYRIDVNHLLALAESFYAYYTDSLKFISADGSKSGKYKMIIRLRYTRDWEASGSGVDDTIGLLTLTAWSAQAGGHTLAHEVGHCFQYQVHCDNNNQNGWMYGFGPQTSGGNGWWEQCAQWQGFKIYTSEQFSVGNFASYLNTAHKHILHESPRYDKYFIQDYWTMKHGKGFIGRLWNESLKPEDPVETYKRITGVTQEEFNDEMYDRAARFTTWDIPELKSYGTAKITARPQPAMMDVGDNYWQVSAANCPENYGYNSIRLNVPTNGVRVSAYFEGKAGADGFRKNYITQAGWRYGFVALLKNGERVYGDMGSASYNNPLDTIHFDCPAQTQMLWLVVTGTPTSYWRHAWDDNDSNDEQWPYQVKFNQTNLLGQPNVVTAVTSTKLNQIQFYTTHKTLVIENLKGKNTIQILDVSGRLIANETISENVYQKSMKAGIYLLRIYSPNGSVARKVVVR